jgi:hypothetical protein
MLEQIISLNHYHELPLMVMYASEANLVLKEEYPELYGLVQSINKPAYLVTIQKTMSILFETLPVFSDGGTGYENNLEAQCCG